MAVVEWSAAHFPSWDSTPQRYVDAGIVGWGRSRRLGKYHDDALRLKAYLGIQHYDPERWGVAGEAKAKVFLSLFLGGRTISLHTYATMGEALDALDAFRALRSESAGC